MAVDFDTFYNWCKDRFGVANIKVRNTTHGTEICTHSYFAKRLQGIDDHKYHLWMNPSGGKSKHPEFGSYRCWYTDQMGSLVSLVADYDHLDWEEAEEMLTGVTTLRSLEQKVSEFFGYKEELVISAQPTPPPEGVVFPDYTFSLDQMSANNHWRIKAYNYLTEERKLSTTGLYVCTEDKEYGNRIIIPWYDADGKLVFWNARTLSKSSKVIRYMKPKNADQESVLFMTEWPDPGSKVYVMEGELDAKSLQLSGFVGAACGGKHVSATQIELLRPYLPVLAFDTDEQGLMALITSGNELMEKGFDVRYVRPPKAYKDWNKFLQEKGPKIIREYIERFEKRFTPVTADLLKANRK